MSLIEFQDYPSTETPLNAENLNHNFNELIGKVLYENENGTNANITFEEELQYEPKKVKIYYKDEDGTFGFVETENPFGKPIDLHVIRINRNYNSRMIKCKRKL